MILVWFLVLACAAEEPGPERTVEAISVDPDGAANGVLRTPRTTGTLRAWVESEDLDTLLVAEAEDGTRIAEDDDSGGRPTPWIDVPCAAGRPVRFVVRAKSGPGAARLVLVEMPEDAPARADAERANGELDVALAGIATGATIDHREVLHELSRRVTAHPGLAGSEALQVTLLAIAEALDRVGDHPATLIAAQRLVAVQRDRMPLDCERSLRARLLVSSAMGQVGRAAEAIPEMRAVIEASRRTRDPLDRVLSATEAGLGGLLYGIGDMVGAMEYWAAAYDRLARIEPRNERDLAQMQANMAVGAFYRGDLVRAREHVEVARRGAAHILPGSPLDLQIQSVHGAIVTEQGDHEAGRVLAEESLARARATRPPGDVAIAAAELNLALAQVRAGEDQLARVLMQRILAEPPAGLAPDHQVLVQTRFNLAAVNLRLGAVAEAEHELAILMEQFLGELPPAHPLQRGILRNRALALRSLGRLDESAEVEAILLPIVRESLPADHVDRIQVELQCAETDGLRGRSVAARVAVERVARDLIAMLAARALILSPREAEASARSARPILDSVQALLLDPSLSMGRGDLAALAFEAGEAARGIGVAAARSLRATRAGGAEFLELRESARQAQVDVVRAARASALGALGEAVERRDSAQRDLREHLLQAAAAPQAISVEAIVAWLRTDDAVVSWRVCTRNCGGALIETGTEELLFGFVIRADATVESVDLGRVDEIEAACRTWRAELVRTPVDRVALRDSGERVRRLVVDPLRALVPDARRWRMAVDGPLLTLPLDALPDPGARGDELLGDHLRLVTIWSFDAELVPQRAARSESLLLVGDPDFGAPSDGRAPRWLPLPATSSEIDVLAAIRRAATSESEPIEILRGSEASVQRLTSSADGARWLHIATHGAFDADDAPGSLLTSSGDDLASEHARSLRALVPMLRCELALAGANTDRDATLTAEEFDALDLSGCELAVLSACDTGRGEIVAGQGAASFQRGLLGAGARACVTSLWRVPDEPTRELMTHFYRGLWERGLPPDVALWRAKTALRERRAPPRAWAGWVLATSLAE